MQKMIKVQTQPGQQVPLESNPRIRWTGEREIPDTEWARRRIAKGELRLVVTKGKEG